MPTDTERPDSTTAAVDGDCCFSQSDPLEDCFDLLLFHIANVSFCGGKIKPQMQGDRSEVIPVAPNGQSAPAVSPQVCYSTCCIPKSVTAALIQNNFDNEHFYRFGKVFRGFHYLSLALIRVFASLSGYDEITCNPRSASSLFQLSFFGPFGFLHLSFSAFPLLPCVVFYFL